MRPIPSRILTTNVVFKVPVSIDTFQKPVYENLPVLRTAIQPLSKTRKTVNNTEVDLNSILFIDGRLSSPRWPELNIWELKKKAEELGASLKVVVSGAEFTVMTCDALTDDTNHFHHWEVGLV